MFDKYRCYTVDVSHIEQHHCYDWSLCLAVHSNILLSLQSCSCMFNEKHGHGYDHVFMPAGGLYYFGDGDGRTQRRNGTDTFYIESRHVAVPEDLCVPAIAHVEMTDETVVDTCRISGNIVNRDGRAFFSPTKILPLPNGWIDSNVVASKILLGEQWRAYDAILANIGMSLCRIMSIEGVK